MALAGASTQALASSKNDLDNFLGNTDLLTQTKTFLALLDLSDEQRKLLNIFAKTFGCYIVENADAKAIREQLTQLEAELAQSRNRMSLGTVFRT